MPVVHSSASVFSTEGVLTGHGPSSKVSTTSLSRRKSSCLKCSKPNPGPPVVSISTTRAIPSASGLAQAAFAGTGAAAGAGTAGAGAAGAACGAAAPLVAAACDQAAPGAPSEIAPARINAAAMRILLPHAGLCSVVAFLPSPEPFPPPDHHNVVGPALPRQRLCQQLPICRAHRLICRGTSRRFRREAASEESLKPDWPPSAAKR